MNLWVPGVKLDDFSIFGGMEESGDKMNFASGRLT